MDITILIISLALSAFFSGIEIAFVTANRLQIELDKQKGSLSGKILDSFVKKPSNFITTTLIGNNIALVIFGIISAKLIEPLIFYYLKSEVVVLLIQTLISTFIILTIGEFFPKALFRVFANKVLAAFALPFVVIHYLLLPVSFLTKGLTRLFLRLFNVKVSKVEYSLTSSDLGRLVKEHKTENEQSAEIDKEMFENALYLKDVKVRECMVPRPEIAAIEINGNIEELKKIIIDTTHSRILVFRDSIDNIEGYVHHFDLHKRPYNIKSILIPIAAVPETMPVQDLMNMLIKEEKNIAWVVDEFGGTAGVITLEDILEEIFGEIHDEYDEDELVDNQLSANEYILSGRIELDHLEEEYNLKLPEGDYETLGGLILTNHESIPSKNELIHIGQYTFKILDVSETKIETVKLIVEEDE